ncbi:MAG: hypothetical protein KBT03_04790 [Bacteroidales bacterium]|nr:hypothetical protein [Candidatus Scybalousia scybalohippi]
MKRISTIYNLVLDILKEDIEARNNDNYLYFNVCKRIAVDNGLDLTNVTVPEFFLHIASKQYPSYETVSRTRRKAQEQYPFLVADDIIENFRKEQEKAFREFARG